MTVTWIIPDTYGFLVDELEELSTRGVFLRVLSSQPIPDGVTKRLPQVEFHYCPAQSLFNFSAFHREFDTLWRAYKWRLPRNSFHLKPMAGIYKVLLQLEKKQPSDFIHSHFAHPGGIGGCIVDVPQILTLRGYDILTTGQYGALWNPFYRSNIINSYQNRGIITVGSRFTLNRARQILGSSADIRWVKQGLSATTFKKANVFNRENLGINETESILLNIGNLVDVKNHALLLEVFASLSPEVRNNAYLIICGDGPLRYSLEEKTKALGIATRVKFMGRLSREQITDLFELSDLYVHTSMSEGFGNVILEAMLFRLLIVASPVGIAPDIIEHQKNGFLPELGDKASWVQCLTEAIANKSQYKQVLDENRHVVLNEFSMKNRIDSYLDLYQEVIKIANKKQ